MSLPYVRCPSCNKEIAIETDIFLKGVEKIFNNPELDDEEKETKKTEILNKIKFKRYCCKMRVMSAEYHTAKFK